MANFERAPVSLLKNPPASLPEPIKRVLNQPGTYNIFNEADYTLTVPIGNATWKGPQSRVVALSGGDEDGNRLDVGEKEGILLDVTLLSEEPVGPHLWAYLVSAKPDLDPTGILNQGVLFTTQLQAGTLWVNDQHVTQKRLYAESLTVRIMPARVLGAGLPYWNGGTRDQTRDAIIDECNRQGVTLDTQIAYILATVQHETASSFQPVREGQIGTPPPDPQRSEKFRRTNPTVSGYYPYYGRGYVQLTHKSSYEFYGHRLHIDLVQDPDLALQPDVALYILVHGMMNGRFGSPLTHFIRAGKTDFLHARQSVNAMDRATEIAALAQQWLDWLTNR